MFVVDTNVLVYAADESMTEHARCRALLDRWRAQSGAWVRHVGNLLRVSAGRHAPARAPASMVG